MNQKQFEKLVGNRRFGQEKSGQGSSRTLTALRLYLVGGKTAIQACEKAEGLSRAAFYQALKRLGCLPRQMKKLDRASCPHCHQQLPNNRRGLSAAHRPRERSGTPTNAP